jgi:hypothetical protein
LAVALVLLEWHHDFILRFLPIMIGKFQARKFKYFWWLWESLRG